MAVYLSCIVLMLVGNKYVIGAETVGEYTVCQQKASINCIQSNPTFTNMNQQKIFDFFREEDTRFCAHKEDFSMLLTCFLDAQRSCLGASNRNMLATAEAYNDALDYYCKKRMNNPKNFNFTCIMHTADKLGNCVKEYDTSKMRSLNTNSTIAEWSAVQCWQAEIASECYGNSDVLKSCPETKDTLVELMKKVKPESCSGTSVFYNFLLLLFSLHFVQLFV